jgi:hypothetical protein
MVVDILMRIEKKNEYLEFLRWRIFGVNENMNVVMLRWQCCNQRHE